MLHASTQMLIQKLCELTEAGAINWREGERQASRFDTEGYIVEVEAEPPTVRVVDGKGRELERADAADLRATPWPDGGDYARPVAEMATRAHRLARGAEKAISRILSSLSAPPHKPVEPVEPVAREPELEPAAPDFDLADEPKKRPSISAAESEAALAAIAADMYHPAPEAPAPETPAPVVAEPVIAQPAPAPTFEPPPEPATPARRIIHVLAADGTVRQEPAAKADTPHAFGSISAFGHAAPKAPTPNFAAVQGSTSPDTRGAATSLLMTGIHAVSRQVMVENRRPAPQPTPKPAPDAATPNAYKPWA